MDKQKMRRAALYLALAVVLAVFGYLCRNGIMVGDNIFCIIARGFFPLGAVAMATLAIFELVRAKNASALTGVMLSVAYALCLAAFFVRWSIIRVGDWLYFDMLWLVLAALLVLCLALRRLFYQKKIRRLLLTVVIFAACITPMFAHGHDLCFLLHRQRMSELAAQMLTAPLEQWEYHFPFVVEPLPEDKYAECLIWYNPYNQTVFFQLAGGWYSEKGYIYYAADNPDLPQYQAAEKCWPAPTGGYWRRFSSSSHDMFYETVSWSEFFSAAPAR